MKVGVDVARQGDTVMLLSHAAGDGATDGVRGLADGRVVIAPLHSWIAPLNDFPQAMADLGPEVGNDIKVLVGPRENS